MTLTLQQEHLIIGLPETEYGRALFAWIQQEVDELESRIESNSKISDDPLHEDFRWVHGMKIAYKNILRKPEELIKEQQIRKQGALK